jgi:uncharacterized protein
MKLLLGHGAWANAASMLPWSRALAERGVEGIPIDLPRGRAERAAAAFRDSLARYPGAAVGGHSFGGRVASLLAATDDVSALVLLSYPLHPPGRPAELRTAHWPVLRCPVIALSGESDPFATLPLLRESILLIRNAELVIYPGLGHSLISVIEDAADRVADFLARGEATADARVNGGGSGSTYPNVTVPGPCGGDEP